MLVMRLPDGTKCEYRLQSTNRGLRLVTSCASYDVVTMVRDAGWTIDEVKTDIARKRLRRAFGPTASRPRFVTALALEAAM
jgi:hypothetical protein